MKKSPLIIVGLAVGLIGLAAFYTLYFTKNQAATSPTLSKESNNKTSTLKKRVERKEPQESLSTTLANNFSYEIEGGEIFDIITNEKPLNQRLKLLNNLRKREVTKSEEVALIKYMLTPLPDDSYALKNDLIEHLVRYGKEREKIGQMIVAVLQDKNQDDVIREYLLQHVPEYYENRWNSESNWDNIDEQDRRQLNETLWEMTNLTQGSMAGTALYALNSISQLHEDINKELVFAKAQEVLLNPAYLNSSRIAAIQVLGHSENEQYLQTGKAFATNQTEPVLLQMSAINIALKSKDDKKDLIKYLEDISSGKIQAHPNLQKCAILNLKKINN